MMNALNQRSDRFVTPTRWQHWVAPLTTIHFIAAALFSLALLLYVSNLAPAVAGEDAGEFQFAAYVLGIPHPTGYPLYILFGKLWITLVPIGNIAYRMNLLSAIAAALAVALMFVLIYRVTGQLGAGFVAAIALGTTGWFWEYAIIASARALHEMLMVVMLFLAVTWFQQPTATRARWLAWLALCVGVALAHHRTSTFMLPGVALFVLYVQPTLLKDLKRLGQLMLLVLLPLLSYFYLLVRGLMGAPYAQIGITDIPSWWVVITGANLAEGRLSVDPSTLWSHFLAILATLSQAYTGSGLVLAGIGLIALSIQRRALFILFGAGVLLSSLMLSSVSPEVGIQRGFYMNGYLLVALCMGLGVGGLTDCIAALAPQRLRAMARAALASVCVFGTLWFVSQAGLQYITVLNSAVLRATTRLNLTGLQATRLVEDSLPRMVPNAMVLGDWDQITPFWYYQYVNDYRTDVRFYYSVYQWKEIGTEEHRFNRPLYLTRKVPELQGQKHLNMVGPVVQWAGEAHTQAPADIQPVQARFANQLELIGFRQRLIKPNGWFTTRPYILQLSLVWRAAQRMERNYSISLRLLDADGQPLTQEDSAHPVLGLFPTTLWDDGEVVEDYYELRAPPADQSQAYHVDVMVYWRDAAGAFHNLKLDGADRERFALSLIAAP